MCIRALEDDIALAHEVYGRLPEPSRVHLALGPRKNLPPDTDPALRKLYDKVARYKRAQRKAAAK